MKRRYTIMKNNDMRIEDMRNWIVLIKSDLYCEEWDDIIEQKVDILDEIDDLLDSYQNIEM